MPIPSASKRRPRACGGRRPAGVAGRVSLLNEGGVGDYFQLRLHELNLRHHYRARPRRAPPHPRDSPPGHRLLFPHSRPPINIQILRTAYMNGSRPSSRLSAGALDDPPIPTHSQPQTSKRKGAEDINPLAAAIKRPRKEVSTYVLCVYYL